MLENYVFGGRVWNVNVKNTYYGLRLFLYLLERWFGVNFLLGDS